MQISSSHPTSTRQFLSWIFFAAIAFLTLGLMRSSPFISQTVMPMVSCVLQVVAVVYYTVTLVRQRPKRLPNLSSIPKAWRIGIAVVLGLMIVSHALPAHALFLGAAEQFMITSFPQASGAVPLIFNALRAIFLIYVAIALITVMNSFRQGEDWLSVARSPAVVVVVIGLGDVLTTLIVA